MGAVRLAYDLHVPKDGGDSGLCPIIMLHGMFMNKCLFNNVAYSLCETTKRKVYCADLRNHGNSPYPKENNCYLMADDLSLFLEDHKIQKASFVCHSISARAAVVFGIDYPQLVEKIIFVDFYPYGDFDHKYVELLNSINSFSTKVLESIDLNRSVDEIKREIRETITQNQETLMVQAFLELMLTECVKDEKGFHLKYDTDATTNYFLMGRFRLPPYGVYEGPVLFLNADNSTFFKSSLKSEDELKRFFPKAECLTVKDTTHMLPLEKPKEFVEEIRKYLEV